MIYIIRHGQTAKNKASALQGRSDDPLNENGILQAEEAGKWFAAQGITIDKVYSSPLSRAQDTAALIAPEIKPVTDGRLIEMDYGPYEGMDLRDPAPEVLEFFSDLAHNPAPEGMEQLSSVVERAGDFLESIKEEASDKNILISTHAIAMKGILEYLTPGANGKYWPAFIGNCSVYACEVSAGCFGIPFEISPVEK